jgi:hypothetical protein
VAVFVNSLCLLHTHADTTRASTYARKLVMSRSAVRVRSSALLFSCNLQVKPHNSKKPPHQVWNYPADHKILDDACASASAVITSRRVLSADRLDLLLAPTTTCSP